MSDAHTSSFRVSAEALASAIEKLGVFGIIKEKQGAEGGLKEKILRARAKIAPIFSLQSREESRRTREKLEQEILAARDCLKCSVPLIQRFQEGNVEERSLAHSAIEVIKRYNACIQLHNHHPESKIKHLIELPAREVLSAPILTSSLEAAQKLFKNLKRAPLPSYPFSFPSTHKKGMQFLIDIFRMKAIRLFQSNPFFSQKMKRIWGLLKNIPLEIDDKMGSGFIYLRQELIVGSGEELILEASFKQGGIDSQMMTFPTLEEIHFKLKKTHQGFPFPTERMGWALDAACISAAPLRSEQTPLFHGIDERRKQLAEKLMEDSSYASNMEREYQTRKAIFDKKREEWMHLHRELLYTILDCIDSGKEKNQTERSVVDRFFHTLAQASSPFDLFTHIQKRLLYLFVEKPSLKLKAKAFEEAWHLVQETPIKKYQSSLEILHEERLHSLKLLDCTHPIGEYLSLIGYRIGAALEKIILQYASEKMGFHPPKLCSSERRFQICAFQQLLSFLAPSKIGLEDRMREEIEEDLQILRGEGVRHILSWGISQELEVYFRERAEILSSRRGVL